MIEATLFPVPTIAGYKEHEVRELVRRSVRNTKEAAQWQFIRELPSDTPDETLTALANACRRLRSLPALREFAQLREDNK